MSIILDGKITSKKIKENLKKEVDVLKEKGINPKLAVILVGEDKASKVYVKNKSKSCEQVGVEFEEYLFNENITQEELIKKINELNDDDTVTGILLQSPIPRHLNEQEAFNAISSEKDVDGFNAINVGNLSLGKDCFISCTPYGIIKMLEEYKIDLEGKHAVIVGRSNIVGKPMIQCLLEKNATVTICHSKTKNLQNITKQADILIVAMGKPKFITKEFIKDGTIVIDVGINRLDDGKICGDVDFESVEPITSFITPVPGGVGPMTIAMLMNNVVKAAKNKN